MADFSLSSLTDLPLDLWVGGKERPASDGGRFDVLDPATGEVITSVANGTVEDAMACVEAAARRRRVLGRDRPPRAGRDPAPGVRADDGPVRRDRPPDLAGERQGAAGRPRRDGVRRRVLPLVRRGGGPRLRLGDDRAVRCQPDRRPPAAGGHRGAGDPVELPGRDGHPQDRPGPRGRLPGDPQAGLRHPAHRAADGEDPGRTPASPRASSPSSPPAAPARSSRRCCTTRGSASSPSPAPPRSAGCCSRRPPTRS